MKPLVIYHANCWDGFCAAWVARSHLGDIEPHPAHYGSTAPIVRGRDVYVLDFSYPRAEMERMHGEADSLVVIDHHATAREALAGLPFCIFDMEHSGGRLTWDYFRPGIAPPVRPWLVDYTEDRDLWRHALPDSEEINAALRSYPLDFDLWDSFDHGFIRDSLVGEGRAIRRAERQIVQSHVRNAKRQDVGGYLVPTVNATVMFSEIAGELAKGEHFGACYFDRQDGRRQWSLRSAPDGLDVSVIAKAHGGGGHKHAAGFEVAPP